MAKLNVFVACPYTLFPLDDYKAVYGALEKSYPVKFRFADEQITSQHILDKIEGYIRESNFSLFDVTGWNANVALELGIAVGAKAPYFILFNDKYSNSDVPSDVRGKDRIQYTSNQLLEAKLSILLQQQLPKEAEQSDTAFGRIADAIKRALVDKPGQTVVELAAAVGEEKALVQSVARALAASNDLTTVGQTKGTRYLIAPTLNQASGGTVVTEQP